MVATANATGTGSFSLTISCTMALKLNTPYKPAIQNKVVRTMRARSALMGLSTIADARVVMAIGRLI